MVKRMNKYDELVNWLQEQHNEVFNQWAQIEAELNRKLEEANLKDIIRQHTRAREQWEERKTKIQAFLDSEDSNELREDLKKVIQFNLDIAGHEYNGQIIEPYHAWSAIRSLLNGQPNSPIKAGGVLL